MSTINMIRGVEFFIAWRWIYGDAPKDLTDYKVEVQIRPYDKSSEVLATFDRDSPYLIVNDLDGGVSLNIPPSITLAYTFNKAVIDCYLVNNSDTDGERSIPTKINLNWGVAR